MIENANKSRISGKDATQVSIEAQKYPPVQIRESDESSPTKEVPDTPQIPAQIGTLNGGDPRKAPPRVRKPSPLHDQYLAPTLDLEGYRARLREAFGNTQA